MFVSLGRRGRGLEKPLYTRTKQKDGRRLQQTPGRNQAGSETRLPAALSVGSKEAGEEERKGDYVGEELLHTFLP